MPPFRSILLRINLQTEIENLSCGIGKVLLPALSGRKADDFLLTRLKQKAISTTRAQTGQEKRIRAHFEHGFAFKIKKEYYFPYTLTDF